MFPTPGGPSRPSRPPTTLALYKEQEYEDDDSNISVGDMDSFLSDIALNMDSEQLDALLDSETELRNLLKYRNRSRASVEMEGGSETDYLITDSRRDRKKSKKCNVSPVSLVKLIYRKMDSFVERNFFPELVESN